MIAPDRPAFGQTTPLLGTQFTYTFDNLAKVIDTFTVEKDLDSYAIYVSDFGATVGWDSSPWPTRGSPPPS